MTRAHPNKHCPPVLDSFVPLSQVAQGRCWQETPAHEQVVTAMPEVQVYPRSADDLCVVLASDGLFGNVMTSEEVASRALEGFARHAHTGAPSTPCALAPA